MYGGSALLNGVNAITPHFSGAVDIMVVEQPDGSYRSTPFYGNSEWTRKSSQILSSGPVGPPSLTSLARAPICVPLDGRCLAC